MLSTSLIALLTNIVFGFIELLLSLRLLLVFLGASTKAPFVNWVYMTSNPLLSPFEGMFPSRTIPVGFNIDTSTLFALIIYSFIGYFLKELLDYISYQTQRYRSDRFDRSKRNNNNY